MIAGVAPMALKLDTPNGLLRDVIKQVPALAVLAGVVYLFLGAMAENNHLASSAAGEVVKTLDAMRVAIEGQGMEIHRLQNSEAAEEGVEFSQHDRMLKMLEMLETLERKR